MQISSRFTMATHILVCIDTFKDDHKLTSDFLAGSVNVNPVIIRKLLQQLKAAGIIEVARGTGGVKIIKPLNEISLYDLYVAVESVENGELFHFYENPNQASMSETTCVSSRSWACSVSSSVASKRSDCTDR
jgi:DNA-binding IscR family transcriptional regulator